MLILSRTNAQLNRVITILYARNNASHTPFQESRRQTGFLIPPLLEETATTSVLLHVRGGERLMS